MKKFEKVLDTAMRFLMALFMLALVLGGPWQIVTKLAGHPSTVTDEFLRFVLIWASLIGSAYCFYRDEHLSLDLVKDRVKGPAAMVLAVFIEAMILFLNLSCIILSSAGSGCPCTPSTTLPSCTCPTTSCTPSCPCPACLS